MLHRSLVQSARLFAAVSAVLVGASSAQAVGVFTSATFTDTASSGISSAKTYTHLANFGEPNNAVINAPGAVTFIGYEGPAVTGPNFTLEGPDAQRPDDADAVPPNTTGETADLLNEFIFGIGDVDADPLTPAIARLTLSGLSVGTAYVTTFYNAPFGSPGGRSIDITTSDGGAIVFDQNFSGDPDGGGPLASTANVLRYSFTAEATSLQFNFDPTGAAAAPDSFHHYAFSNEVVPEPTSLGLLALGAVGLLARRRRSM